MAKLSCCVAGDNHSDDVFKVWIGEPLPSVVCGYHFFARKVVK
jgi:hypothetical protein